ncbi:MAG: 3-hydroxylacyl-ACP dehydratase [Pseudomonadota bacterium]
MIFPDIGHLVPHDGQMILLERVLAADKDSLCAELTIAPETMFCDGFGVGAWVGVEYMAQAIAAHAGYKAHLRGEPVKVGLLLGARRYQCSVPLFALGTVLHVHAQHAMQGDNGLAAFECRIDDAASGAMLAHATITVFEPDNVNEFLQRSFT